MSNQQMKVTLSATDQASPSMKTIIATMTDLLNQAKLLDAGLTGVQGKLRTAFSSAGASNLFPTKQITDFSAGLNQAGINMDLVSSRTTSARSKFAAFGQAVLANGTAFGVAGASAFGLFNAIDDLEKVQLKASTATLRSQTATTALAVAEKSLAEAKASGTASTADIAVLEARVADARERVSITTERAAIFQQDYTEALAGLALQVGPQAIALAGSLAQVYNVLSTTLGKQGGIINTLKSAFLGLNTSTVQTRVQVATLSPAFGAMATSEEVATVATRGLSTAMKGLLISTGIGAAIAIGATIFETMSANAEKADTTVQDLSASTDEFGTTAQSAAESAQTGFDTLLKTLTDIENKQKTMSIIFKGAVVEVTKAQADAARIDQAKLFGANIDPTFQLNKLKQQKDALLQGISQQKGLGFDTTGLEKDVATIDEKMAKLNVTIDENNKKLATDAAVLAAWDAKLKSAGGSLDVATGFGETWLTVNQQAAKDELEHAGSLENLAVKLGIVIPETVQGTKALQDYLGKILGFPVATDKAADSQVTWQEALKKANDEAAISVEEGAKMFVAEQKNNEAIQAMTVAFAGRAAAQQASIGQQQAFNDLIVKGIVAMEEQEAAILTERDANLVATQATKEHIVATGEELIAMTDVGKIYDNSATSLLALTQAKVAGVQAAQAFVTKTAEEQVTLDANTAALQNFIATEEGIKVPPALVPTLDLLTKMQQEIAKTGNAATTLNQALKAAAAPAFDVISKAVGSKSIDEFKKAFKDIEFGDIPKKLEKALEQGGEKIQHFSENARETFNLTGTIISEALVGAISDKTFDQGIDAIIKKMKDLGKAGGPEGLQPLIAQLKSLKDLPMDQAAAKLEKLGPVIELIAKNSADGSNDVNDINEELALLDKIMGDTSGPDAFSKSIDGAAASLSILKTRIPTAGDLASIERLKNQFLHPDQPPGPDESFRKDQPPGGDGKDGAPVVPGPEKATDFDKKKQAILDEVTNMFTTAKIAPAVIPAPDEATQFQTGLQKAIDNSAQTVEFIKANLAKISATPMPAVDEASVYQKSLQLAIDNAIQTVAFIASNLAGVSAVPIPAPNSAEFTKGLAAADAAAVAFGIDVTTNLQTAVVIPAPNTDGFTSGIDTAVTDATTSLDEIRVFLEDDMQTAFDTAGSDGVQSFVDGVDTASTDITDSLQEIVDFLNDDMQTAFEDMQSAAEDAASGVVSAMGDIQSAAEDATSAVQDLIDALNNIPTNVDVTINVGLEGPGVAFLARGYHGVVDKPTLLVVGEAGAERVDVGPATGPATGIFMEGDGSRSGVINPTVHPLGMQPTQNAPQYTAPPAMVGGPTSVIANITIPVYVNGQYQGTQQSVKVLRDLGALIS